MAEMGTGETLAGVSFLIGDTETAEGMRKIPAMEPFAAEMLDMLDGVSRFLMADREAKAYPDVVTFAFWIRRTSTRKMKERFCNREDFCKRDGLIHLGRGVAFHIAPSNVPVNFAYSLAAGLLTGNANIVRVPSKEFPQVDIVCGAFRAVLAREKYGKLRPYVCLVRYGHDRGLNDRFSAMADTRIIWGGDGTIAEIRRSPLAPRAGEVTFADRFSLAVIDSGSYMGMDDGEKERAAENFYNDTYLTDQNACTSPRLVAWLGDNANQVDRAKEEFWGRLHEIVRRKYRFQPIQGVDKLTSGCLAAAAYAARSPISDTLYESGQRSGTSEISTSLFEERDKVRIKPHSDNLLVRVEIPWIMDGLMDLKDNSGYFFEYNCKDILELKSLCDDKRCQTIAYIGDMEMFGPLLRSGVCGIDRVVPVGKTMDFNMIWDGYNLYERLTRTVCFV